MKSDEYQMSIMARTAESFQKLAALRGVRASITVNRETGNYEAVNEKGEKTECGVTTFRLTDWLNAQPGVKP